MAVVGLVIHVFLFLIHLFQNSSWRQSPKFEIQGFHLTVKLFLPPLTKTSHGPTPSHHYLPRYLWARPGNPALTKTHSYLILLSLWYWYDQTANSGSSYLLTLVFRIIPQYLNSPIRAKMQVIKNTTHICCCYPGGSYFTKHKPWANFCTCVSATYYPPHCPSMCR